MKTASDTTARARQLIGLLDLTSLDDRTNRATVEQLCARAITPYGPVAAVCIPPAHVQAARRTLGPAVVRICTVANFPGGQADRKRAAFEIRESVAAGAQEVDVVYPFSKAADESWASGEAFVRACKTAAGNATLKVILETGALPDPSSIARASRAAIAGGADFLKTSTGTREPAATPKAAETMLRVIAEQERPVGFKAAGGIRQYEQAVVYMDLARDILGEAAIMPERFRIGASSLLDDLIDKAKGTGA